MISSPSLCTSLTQGLKKTENIHILVTYPTKTLSQRDIWMRTHVCEDSGAFKSRKAQQVCRGKNVLLSPQASCIFSEIVHDYWLLNAMQPLGIWYLPTIEGKSAQTKTINTSGRLIYFCVSELFPSPRWRRPWDISTNTMKGETTHDRFVKPGLHIQKEISLPNSTTISKQYNIY